MNQNRILHFLSQCSPVWKTGTIGLIGGFAYQCVFGLNVVRSGRPEQCLLKEYEARDGFLSQCSPVWKTGTIKHLIIPFFIGSGVSM